MPPEPTPTPVITPERMSVERVERVNLPTGTAGTDATIDVMARAACGIYGAGSAIVRNRAIQILRDAGIKERDKRSEVSAIHAFVKKHLRYVSDPLWYEFVTFPETLLADRADGDCDDHAVLESALLGAIGIPTRFVTYGFNGNPPSHVALHALVGKKWIPLDPIVKDKPDGWEVPDYDSRTIYGVNSPTGYANTKFSFSGMTGFLFVGAALWLLHRRASKKLL